jgi:hypothetical protein
MEPPDHKPKLEEPEPSREEAPNAAHDPGPVPVKTGKRYTWSPSEGWIEHDADHVVLI